MSSTGTWQGVVHAHLIWLLWFMDSVRAQYGLTYREPRLQNPKTIIYEVTIVVQHHPLFITAGDRAYRLNCIYRQADALLTQKINVNDPTPQAIEGKSTPQCRYDVLSSVNGPTLRFANVGEPVIHKWSCNSELHGFVVHSCVVRNPSGEEYKLIDDRGCVIEKQLVPDVKYEKDLSSAYTTISAFRFAEQIVVHFSCQITLCRKHEQGCEGIAPPTCVPVEFPPIRTFYRHTRPFEPAEATTQPGPPSTSEIYGLGSGELVTKTTVRPTTTTTLSNRVESVANFHDPLASAPIPLPKRGEEGQDANVVWSSGESPEFGIEIVKTPSSAPHRMFPEVPNDYRTETLSSVYDVPLGHDLDPMPRPAPAQIYYASKRKPRSHKLPATENITLEVEAKKLMVFSDESDRLDVPSSNSEDPGDKRCDRIIISQTVFLSAAALLQATSIAVILIQRRLYKRNVEELLLRIPSRPF
ncbi:unnamed protein product [Cylicocyclus nassatus]|uniref:ZP domain-containing protein n=1 Tax=Cylicocyclus nassatus TaxID=53992 RepID=A0AA36M9S0_CYLNA|nr:unnamed protein product [Cylicocyclus nassatus]